MTDSSSLFLYEEIMLLALRDETGDTVAGFVEHAVAGAVLAELLLTGRISVDETRKELVDLVSTTPLGDPIIDECLERVAVAKRRASLKTWLSRLAGTKKLKERVVRQLCDRGILRADEDRVLWLFTRKVYSEINPVPEKEIVERMRTAIFTDDDQLEPRTTVLVSLASGANLLGETFGRKEVRNRQQRIEQIVNGEMTGKVTKEIIAASQAAAAAGAVAATAAMVVTVAS